MKTGEFEYEVVEGWGIGPKGKVMGGIVPGVAVDSGGRVFLSRREPSAILVYNREGHYLDTWGEDIVANPHLLWIDSHDHVYCACCDDHTVRIFDPDGRPRRNLRHARPIRRSRNAL